MSGREWLKMLVRMLAETREKKKQITNIKQFREESGDKHLVGVYSKHFSFPPVSHVFVCLR